MVQEETVVVVNYKGPPTIFDKVTQKTINIVGKVAFPMPYDRDFCILIATIPAKMVYGLYALGLGDLKLKFPGTTIS